MRNGTDDKNKVTGNNLTFPTTVVVTNYKITNTCDKSNNTDDRIVNVGIYCWYW